MATLTEVVKELREQNRTLNTVRDRLDAEARAREAAARQEAEDRRKSLEDRREQKGKAPSGQTGGFKSGVISGVKSATGFNFLENLAGYLKPLVSGVFAGLFGGAAITALRTSIGKMVGRGLIFGPVIVLLQQFGEKALTYLFEEVNDYLKANGLGFSSDQVKGLAGSVNDALINGLMLATIFGKKGLFAGFLGSMITDAFKAAFPDVNWEEKAKILGFELPITKETFTTIGATIAAYFGPSLIFGAITKAFGGTARAFPGSRVGRDAKGRFTKLSGPNLKSFRLGFGGRFAAASILMMAGGIIGDYISDNFGEVAGAATSNAIDGATIGWMLAGPWGAFAGVVVGGIVTLAQTATNNINANAEKADEIAVQLKEKLDKAESSWWASVVFGWDQIVDGLFGNSEVAAMNKATDDALQEIKNQGGLSERTRKLQRGMLQAYMSMSTSNIENLAEEANAQVIGDLLRMEQMGHLKMSPSEKQRLQEIQKYLTQSAPDAFGGYLSEDGSMDGLVDFSDYRKKTAAEIVTTAAEVGGMTVDTTPVVTADLSNVAATQAEIVRNDTINALSNFGFDDTSSPPPVVSFNNGNTTNNVTSSQPMVTNNGPVVDISDSMIMRHGAPSAL
jgi:hypothetical protein